MLLAPTMTRVFASAYAEEARNTFLRSYAAWQELLGEKEAELSVASARTTLRKRRAGQHGKDPRARYASHPGPQASERW